MFAFSSRRPHRLRRRLRTAACRRPLRVSGDEGGRADDPDPPGRPRPGRAPPVRGAAARRRRPLGDRPIRPATPRRLPEARGRSSRPRKGALADPRRRPPLTPAAGGRGHAIAGEVVF